MESKTDLDKERLPFAELLGVKILTAEAARVTAEMLVPRGLMHESAGAARRSRDGIRRYAGRVGDDSQSTRRHLDHDDRIEN